MTTMLEELLAEGVPERVARQIAAVEEALARGELPPDAIPGWDDEEEKRFDPHQPRDPHTGEWIDEPGGGIGLLERPEEPSGGGSIADNLDLPKSGKVREGVLEAIDGIDSVLNLPNLPRISVKPTGGKHLGGAYKRKRNDDGTISPDSIQITTDRPSSAFAHEYGHFIDDQLLSVPVVSKGRRLNAMGSTMGLTKHMVDQGEVEPHQVYLDREGDPDDDLVDLMAKLNASPTVEEMKTASMNDYAAHQYMIRPVEQFARAFNQWVAIRSRNQRLLDDLDRERDLEYAIDRAIQQGRGQFAEAGETPVTRMQRERFRKNPDSIPKILTNRQWPDDEFEPIAEAFDKLFEGRGWLKTR